MVNYNLSKRQAMKRFKTKKVVKTKVHGVTVYAKKKTVHRGKKLIDNIW